MVSREGFSAVPSRASPAFSTHTQAESGAHSSARDIRQGGVRELLVHPGLLTWLRSSCGHEADQRINSYRRGSASVARITRPQTRFYYWCEGFILHDTGRNKEAPLFLRSTSESLRLCRPNPCVSGSQLWALLYRIKLHQSSDGSTMTMV